MTDSAEMTFVKNSRYVPSTWDRLWARLIDDVVRVALGWSLWSEISVAEAESLDYARISLYWVILAFLAAYFYEVLSLWLFQTTLGKYLFDLRVESVSDASEISWSQASLRVILSWFHFLFSWGLFATLFFRYDRRHWVDLISETRVVSTNPGSSRPIEVWSVLGVVFMIFFSWTGIERAAFFLNHVRVEKEFIELPIMDSDYKFSFDWDEDE